MKNFCIPQWDSEITIATYPFIFTTSETIKQFIPQ